MSIKFQITLPEDLAAELKAAAAKRGASLAQFIREAMEEKLREAKTGKSSDPFAWMDCLVPIDETDLAARVDEVLYGDASLR